jgi:hypothetical protein
VESMVLQVLGKCCTCESHPQPFSSSFNKDTNHGSSTFMSPSESNYLPKTQPLNSTTLVIRLPYMIFGGTQHVVHSPRQEKVVIF